MSGADGQACPDHYIALLRQTAVAPGIFVTQAGGRCGGRLFSSALYSPVSTSAIGNNRRWLAAERPMLTSEHFNCVCQSVSRSCSPRSRLDRGVASVLLQFTPDLFSDDGQVSVESTEAFLHDYMAKFSNFIGRALSLYPRQGLCCTNRLMAGVPLSPDRLIPRAL